MSGAECQRSFRLYDEYLADGGRFSVNLGEKAAKLRARIHSGLMNQVTRHSVVFFWSIISFSQT